MTLEHTPVCEFGTAAPDFRLPGVDGKDWTRDDCRGARGLLVVFMCNHCPYVKAIREKLGRDARDLQRLGIGVVGINANDAEAYPEDSFANMQRDAREFEYPFPYLYDESQSVARAYGAVCTPDFFGYNADLELQYRGRLDASGRQPDSGEQPRALYEAMKQVAETGAGPSEQVPSMGCSIKWRAPACP